MATYRSPIPKSKFLYKHQPGIIRCTVSADSHPRMALMPVVLYCFWAMSKLDTGPCLIKMVVFKHIVGVYAYETFIECLNQGHEHIFDCEPMGLVYHCFNTDAGKLRVASSSVNMTTAHLSISDGRLFELDMKYSLWQKSQLEGR